MTQSFWIRILPSLALGLMAAWLVACRSVPAQTQTPPIQKLIQLERIACMGPCPVDQLTVYSDGQMEYTGGANAPRTGRYVSLLTAAERKELTAQFEAANFFAFQDSYASSLSDLPTTYTTYWQGGKSKRIRDYDNAPTALKALEAELIALIKADRWRQAVIPAQ